MDKDGVIQHPIRDAFPPQRLFVAFTRSDYDHPHGLSAGQRLNALLDARNLLLYSHYLLSPSEGVLQ
jgi:hypothetical protein